MKLDMKAIMALRPLRLLNVQSIIDVAEAFLKGALKLKMTPKLLRHMARTDAMFNKQILANQRHNLDLRVRAWIMACPKRRAWVRGLIGERAIERWNERFRAPIKVIYKTSKLYPDELPIYTDEDFNKPPPEDILFVLYPMSKLRLPDDVYWADMKPQRRTIYFAPPRQKKNPPLASFFPLELGEHYVPHEQELCQDFVAARRREAKETNSTPTTSSKVRLEDRQAECGLPQTPRRSAPKPKGASP